MAYLDPPAITSPSVSVLMFPNLFRISEQLISRNMERFRERLVFKAHRLLYHSTLGSKAIKQKKRASPSVSVLMFPNLFWGLWFDIWFSEL